MSQNREGEMFLEELRDMVLLADRGFGRVSLPEKLESLGFSYILRVPAHVFVQGDSWNFPLRFGCSTLVRFSPRRKGNIPSASFFALTPSQEEPSLEVQRILKGYQRRMDIEEGFRDFKNHRTVLVSRTLSSPSLQDTNGSSSFWPVRTSFCSSLEPTGRGWDCTESSPLSPLRDKESLGSM